jgi:hypothetical protein
MMATPADPEDELIEEAIPGFSSSFDRPPWTRARKEKLHDLVAAHMQPHQMTKEEGPEETEPPPSSPRRSAKDRAIEVCSSFSTTMVARKSKIQDRSL